MTPSPDIWTEGRAFFDKVARMLTAPLPQPLHTNPRPRVTPRKTVHPARLYAAHGNKAGK